MEQYSSVDPEDQSFEAVDESTGRSLTAAQMVEFRERVAKEMQLRAQRSQPEAQQSTTRGLQRQRRQEHGNRVLRHLKRQRGY